MQVPGVSIAEWFLCLNKAGKIMLCIAVMHTLLQQHQSNTRAGVYTHSLLEPNKSLPFSSARPPAGQEHGR